MISRSNMRRQLRASGGITNARQMAAFGGIMGSDGRKQYGIGSWLKEKIRKLIPNELADIAVKAAPFVAPFNPAIAGLMSGVGSFDKTGRMGDSLKKGALTYGGGQLARYAGGADFQGNPFGDGGAFRGGLEGIKGGFSSPLGTKTGFKLGTESTTGTGTNNPLSDSNAGAKKFAEDQGKGFMERTADKLFSKAPFGDKIPQIVKEQLLVGGATGVAKYLYDKLIGGYPEPTPGEDMKAYMEERRQRVGTQMRTYMDNYLAYDPEYSAMSEEQKNAFVERNNKNMGGLMRQNYQTGGITMANSIAQNKAINDARRIQNQNMLEAARGRLPGYQAPPRAMAPAKAPMLTPADLNPPQFNDPPPLQIRPTPIDAPTKIIQPPVARIQPMPMQPAKPTYTYVHEEGYEVDGPGPNIGRIENPPSGPGAMMPTPEGTMGPISLDDFEPQNKIDGPLTVMPQLLQTDEEILAEREKNQPTQPGGPADDMRFKKQPVDDGSSLVERDLKKIERSLPQDSSSYYQGKDYGPKSGMAYAANMPKRGMTFVYDENGNRYQVPIEGYEGPTGPITEPLGLAKLAVGGRVGQNMGGLMRLNYMIGGEAKQMEAGAPPIMYSGNMDPNAQAGLPSVPGPMQMAEDGPEFDMRENGGFQPLGRQEGKDDVPAMLAKNEFVMTADAVRAAGGGSIQKGAQKMYDTMKKLESRVS